MANFFDQFDGPPPAQAAGTPASGNFFDQFDDPYAGMGDPQQNLAVPGGIDAAFQQMGEQPAAAPADQQRMEQLASAYRRAPEGQGMAVDKRARELMETTNPYVRATMQGLTFGLEDELGAGIQTMTGQGNGYDFNLAASREAMDRARAQNPAGMAGAEIFGALLTAPLTPAVRLVQGAGWGGRVANSTATGAAYGGAYGFGAGEGAEGRASSAISGAAVGGALGGALGAVIPGARAPAAQNDVIAAAERVGVNVPTAIASNSMVAQRAGQAIRNVPLVGDAIPRATREATEGLGQAVTRTADDLGHGSGPNVANRIGRAITSNADAETGAARQAAEAADAAAMRRFEGQIGAARGAVDARESAALQQSRAALGSMTPQEMGQTLIQRLKTGEEQARALKSRLYDEASQPGAAAVQAGAVREARARVAQDLENAGRPIDTTLTPASARMLDEIERLSSLNIQNKAVGARPAAIAGEEPTIAAVDLNGIELVRKRLNSFSQAAGNDADRSAARMIIRSFDDWLETSFDNALFSGSDDALRAFQAARKANADWRTKFGFNGRDDADKIINKIVTGEITPQEASNWIVGAAKVGAQGLSSRLLTRIAEATGGDAAAMQAIRGGVWSRLSQTAEGVESRAPAKVANDIYEFLNGSGQAVANRIFSAEQKGVMRAYANTLRRGIEDRAHIDQVAKTGRPKPNEVGIGPMQALANSVVGRGRSDEALYSAIDAYAKSGARGDIKTLSDILRVIPQEDRAALAGSIVRQIGISPRTGQWSPDVFLSQWRSYTPQAKALLFGASGKHRADLDDIATIAQRFQDVGRMFGNPSGTAQNTNAFIGAGALWAEPVTAISAALGGAVAARVLSAPATANSMARWSRAYETAVRKPARGALIGAQTASRRFASDIGRELGLTQYTQQINQALQNAVANPSTNDGVEDPRPVNE